MPRPPIPLGTWGKIARTAVKREKVGTRYIDTYLVTNGQRHFLRTDTAFEHPITPDAWVARARFRDHDGITRKVEAWGQTGAAAERALISQLVQRTVPSGDDLTSESTLSGVWEIYRRQLVADGKALRTIDRYDYVGLKIKAALGNVRVREATTQRLDTFIRTLAERNGPSVAKTARVLLSGMFGVAVRYGACAVNPTREVSSITSKAKASRALTVDELQAIIRGVRMSQTALPPLAAGKRQTSRITIAGYCTEADIADVITLFAATGCRISEALALRWSDVDLEAKTIAITGHVIAVKGRGLIREASSKTEAGERVLPLPSFAVAALMARQVSASNNPHDVVFPSSVGTLRDPDGLSKQWRRVRDALGFDWVTTHTFRRTLATIIDDAGMSARVGADQLGHSHVSMTQDVYFGRGQTHTAVADALDSALGVI